MSIIKEYIKNCIKNSDEVLHIDRTRSLKGEKIYRPLDKVEYPRDTFLYVEDWIDKHGKDIGYIYGLEKKILTIDLKDGILFMGKQLGCFTDEDDFYWQAFLWPDVRIDQVLSYIESHSDSITEDLIINKNIIKEYSKCYRYYKNHENILNGVYGISNICLKWGLCELHQGYYMDIQGEDINLCEFLKCGSESFNNKLWVFEQLVESQNKWKQWKKVRDFLSDMEIDVSSYKNFEFISGVGLRLIGGDWQSDQKCKEIVELGKLSRNYGTIINTKTAEDFIELVMKHKAGEIDISKYKDCSIDEYCIYMHKCIETGKIYIGQTCMLPEIRWDGGEGYRYNKEFFKDIIKYGWNNFKHIVLCTGLSKESADRIENFLIKVLETTNPENGYNKKINESVIRDKQYNVYVPKERKKITLKDKKIDMIKNGRVLNPAKGNIRLMMKRWYESSFDKASFFDAGNEFLDLPRGIIWYMKVGDFYQIHSPFSSNDIYDSEEPLTKEEIKNYIMESKDTLKTIQKYKDLIDEFGECQKFYLDNELELAPFGIKEISIYYYSKSEGGYPWIHFELSTISKKYLMKFLGISLDYWERNKLEVLKMLGKKGTYEKFLEFGDRLDWTL